MPAKTSQGAAVRHLEEDPPRTPRELAHFLGLSEQTLAQWRWLGKGPRWVKVGRHVRYPRRDTQEWMDSGADSPERARPA
jgi:predicted DNA-binding transcriptional regulator AlpA